VGDDRDRVLRLSPPDGAYRVTVGIPEVRHGRMTVEVHTEAGRALQHHAQAGEGATRAELRVEARDGRATLVFHAPPRRWLEQDRMARWAVSWLRVEASPASDRPTP
jgi:hypothetical protein